MGTAVYSLRAQADKDAYSMTMRYTLQNTDHLTLRQAEVTELIVEDGIIRGVKTFSGAVYHAKAVVLATGTYLKARCLYGEVVNYTGPNGLQAANYLSQSLKDKGVELYRFKTGTPARIDKRSVNFDVMEEQFSPFPPQEVITVASRAAISRVPNRLVIFIWKVPPLSFLDTGRSDRPFAHA